MGTTVTAEAANPGRVVLTGAAGRLGSVLRPALASYSGDLLSSDRVAIGQPHAGESFTRCDLSDMQATQDLVSGAKAVVHFGGISNQRPFEELIEGNFLGLHNVFQAAQREGVSRLVYASSNHAVGFYPVEQVLDADAAYRPDSFYGLSKAFGELTGRLFHDRYGLEVVCLRIGSCTERPTKKRHLATWLSHADLIRLVLASLSAKQVGFEVLYGVSDNSRSMWRNDPEGAVRYLPQDSADSFAGQLDDTDETEWAFQGGQACFREVQ